ncbi:MAG: hypothetical protein KF760_07485 [Candidatus Eremiobacteraeota bacterium]|nr:hypothetical protein [Candidatus Eremiobacteraeota bacterium]MCW5869754.1 hypothetical protein [Candidatus Eremiobacteraeota bacterium]
MQWTYDSPATFLGILAALLLAYAGGLRLARRMLGVPSLETVLLVWVGLFLSLSLQQASQVYRQRIDLVHEEADSIANVYRVLESLPPAQRTQMRLLVIAYLDAKLGQAPAGDITGLQDQQFKLCCELAANHVISEPQGLALRASIDRMISLHYRCFYVLEEHLPTPLVALLLAQCLAASLLLGLGGRHPLLGLTLIALMVGALATLADVDDASHGWVRVDRSNLRDLVNSMHQQEQL